MKTIPSSQVWAANTHRPVPLLEAGVADGVDEGQMLLEGRHLGFALFCHRKRGCARLSPTCPTEVLGRLEQPPAWRQATQVRANPS